MVKKKKFAKDVLLNILSSLIMNILLQLILYPYFGAIFSADEYGRILLLTGLTTMFASLFGNTLNNARLVVDTEYKKKGCSGDFNPIFVVAGILSIVLVIVTAIFADAQLTVGVGIGMVLTVILSMFKQYYSVQYRLVLNFKKLLLCSVWYCIGGLIGLAGVHWLGFAWIVPFVTAEAGGALYVFCVAKEFLKEPFKLTVLFPHTRKVYILLVITNLMANLVAYMDRFILYPFMGGTDVAIYTTASFFGRSLGLVMSPLAGVILSYYANKPSLKKNAFLVQTGVLSAACAVFYLISITGVSMWFTGLLYPTLIEGAAQYIWIANLSAVIMVAGSLLQPAVLKYCNTKWQPLIQGTHMAIYFGLGICFLKIGGLWGFCVASLLANIIKFVMLFIIGFFSLRKSEKVITAVP